MLTRQLFFVLLAVYLVLYRAVPLARGPAVYRDDAPVRMAPNAVEWHIALAVVLYLYAAWRDDRHGDDRHGADPLLSVLWLLMDLTLVGFLNDRLRIRDLSLAWTWLVTVPFMILLPWPSRHQWAWTRAFLVGAGLLSLAVEVKRWFARHRTTAPPHRTN